MKLTHPPLLADVITVRPRFGRSVHLERDLVALDAAAAAASYFLLPSGVAALQAVLHARKRPAERAMTIIGPYGAGKSAFASFLARLVGTPDFAKLAQVPATLGKVPHLRPVVVVGARGALAPALLAALRRDAADALADDPAAARKLAAAEKTLSPRALADAYMAVAAAVARRGPEAGILLLVDEAGKFLEYAAANPLTQDVFGLQELAEAAARATTGGELWVMTVLHQNADAYASRLNRTQQAEWTKVSQRFRELPFFPSDVERMDIVGRALEHKPSLHLNGQLTAVLDEVLLPPATLVADSLRDRFRDLARAAYPLHPVVLLALPAMFRRAGQSHRSIFSFLESEESGALGRFLREHTWDYDNPPFFPLDTLFDYGRDVLLTGWQGPAARPWVEAVEMVDQAAHRDEAPVSALALRALKCIGLLTWLREPRLLPNLPVLRAALGTSVEGALAELQRRQLVVWSRARGTYRLWEGSDVDVEAELERARGSLSGDVPLTVVNDGELFNLPRLITRRHTYQTGTLRTATVETLRPAALATRAQQAAANDELILLLCLAATPTEAAEAETTASALNSPAVLVGIGLETEALREAAALVLAARVVRTAVPALESDRAARRELALRRGEAEAILRAEWHRLFGVALGAAPAMVQAVPELVDAPTTWWWQGNLKALAGGRAFSEWLSEAADITFASTPVLRNELLNRRSLSSAGAGARRELVKAMLLHGDKPRLNIGGYPPEYSMYACVLEATGLHRCVDGVWQWVAPTPETDRARLLPAWQALETLIFGDAAAGPVPLPTLYDTLRRAPFGLTEGVLPVLVAAFRRVYEGVTTLYREGAFVAEESEPDWEMLLRRPELFALADCKVMGARQAVVERIAGATGVAPQLMPVVRRLLKMLATQPDYTRQTRTLPKSALQLRDAFDAARAPEELLFRTMPAAFNMPPWKGRNANSEDVDRFFEQLNGALQIWNTAYPTMRASARDILLEACGLPKGDAGWASLRARGEQLLGFTLPPQVGPFVARLTTTEGDSSVDSILALVANRPPKLWRDTDVKGFGAAARTYGQAFARAWAELSQHTPPPGVEPVLTFIQEKKKGKVLRALEELVQTKKSASDPQVLRAALIEFLTRLDKVE